MPVLTQTVLLVHILSAFAYMAGYVGTNVLTEFARSANDPIYRRTVLALSGRFDRLLNAPGGTIVSLTGLLAVWVFGYSLLTPWIAASVVLWLVVMGLGITYWRRFGLAVDAAAKAGDEQRVTTLLREPRTVLMSRVENLLVISLVLLMVLRPGG